MRGFYLAPPYQQPSVLASLSYVLVNRITAEVHLEQGTLPITTNRGLSPTRQLRIPLTSVSVLVYARYVSAAEDNKSWHRYRDAIAESIKLMEKGQDEEALRLLDDAIAMAMSENENPWVLTLSHHAAVISNSLRNFSREKHYYEKSLEFNPENPIALYGLAEVALEQGDTDLARQFAKRSYEATVQGDDEMAKRGLVDLIAMKWPDIASK